MLKTRKCPRGLRLNTTVFLLWQENCFKTLKMSAEILFKSWESFLFSDFFNSFLIFVLWSKEQILGLRQRNP